MLELIKNGSEHIPVSELKKSLETLKPYMEELRQVLNKDGYDGKESVLKVASDEIIQEDSSMIFEKMVDRHLKGIFVVGIGGSFQGTQAVYEALTGKYDLATIHAPKIYFIDTVSPTLHEKMADIIEDEIESGEEIVMCVVSKSGSTTEVIVNAEIIFELLNERCGDIRDRVVAITEKDSKLWKSAHAIGYTTVDHRNIGGRYSIFSAVGQVPLKLVGISVDEMLEGARDMLDTCLNPSLDENPALYHAAVLAYMQKEHYAIHDNFYFNPELEGLGKWYRQLMSESLGKLHDLDGKEVHNGMLPTVSIGTTDLHSTLQMYFGGPRNIYTQFVYSHQEEQALRVGITSQLTNLVDDIEGKSAAEIMNVIYASVIQAYKTHGMPFTEVVMPEISEYYLGQYMQYRMVETMLLGKLMHVNPFDQPNVEDYKSVARQLLIQSK